MTKPGLTRVLDELALGAEQRWGKTNLFTYCECPDCQFSVVVLSADLVGGTVVACELCWTDSQHMVPMTARPATDADKPEGVDARFAPLERFICAQCGRECLSSVREDEARAEFEERFGKFDAKNEHEALCDDCDRLRMKAIGR